MSGNIPQPKSQSSVMEEIKIRSPQVQNNHHSVNLRFQFSMAHDNRPQQYLLRKMNIASLDSRNTLTSNSPTHSNSPCIPESTLECAKRPIIAALSNLLKNTIKLRLTRVAEDKMEEIDNDELELAGGADDIQVTSPKYQTGEAERNLGGDLTTKPAQQKTLPATLVKKGSEKEDSDLSEELSRNLDWIQKEFSVKSNILDYCYNDKNLNISFQHFIKICCPKTLDIIVSKVNEHLYTIMYDKYGNYLIQKLLERDLSFRSEIEGICKFNFAEMAENEYSSRVLQALASVSPSFRRFVNQYFKENIEFAISKISVTFVLLITMKYSESSTEFYYIEELFISNPMLFEYKLFKRILIAYIQFADDMRIVHRIWKRLSGVTFGSFFDLKFGALILLMLVKRGHQKAMKKIALKFRTTLPSLLNRRYFKLVAEKLLQPKYSPIHPIISQQLQQIPFETLDQIHASSPTDFYFVVYLIVSSFSKETDKELLQQFMKKVELKYGSILQTNSSSFHKIISTTTH